MLQRTHELVVTMRRRLHVAIAPYSWHERKVLEKRAWRKQQRSVGGFVVLSFAIHKSRKVVHLALEKF